MSPLLLALMLTTVPGAVDEVIPLKDDYTAYWLTDALIDSGEAYGPALLLCRTTLPQLKVRSDLETRLRALGRKQPALLLESAALIIETHRKDSIWNQDERPIKPVGRVSEVDERRQELTVDGRRYRFDKCEIKEVVRILDDPTGKQPLHRKHAPLAGARQTARALKLLLKDQIERRRDIINR